MKSSGALVLSLLSACTFEGVQTSSRGAIYGADDRSEARDHWAVAALVPDAAWLSPLPTLGEELGLCAGERFADQPVLASCTGVLIAPDRVLTARHCVPDEERCTELSVVFGFAIDELGAMEVLRCAELIAVGEDEDFAIIRLDRASGREPLELADEGVAVGDAITIVGHPSGLPLKLDAGARIDSIGPRSYRASADTFAGSSGSAVLDARGSLIGIVSGGAEDYADVDGCTRALVYPAGEGREVIIPVERAIGSSAAGCRCAGSGERGPLWLLVLALSRCAARAAVAARSRARA